MKKLTTEQKALLLDYCIGILSESDAAQVEELIFSNSQAADLVKKINGSISPLNSYKTGSCPDELAETTFAKVNGLAKAGQKRLEHLLASEQVKTVKPPNFFLRNIGQLAAVAAIILLFTGTFFPSMRYAREKSWQQKCQAQLARIGQGFTNYKADHDNKMPSVATAEGAPWWKVGYQGKENHSNTRNIWLLAKEGYVDDVTDFVCPSKRQGKVLKIDPTKVSSYNDFPNRKYVTYSFRIKCGKGPKGKKVLMADMNPLFEKLPDSYTKSLMVKLSRELESLNSDNHNRRGQNALFCDGEVRFIKKRSTDDVLLDDIYTLQNTTVYKGTELPSCETDAFLAP